MLKILDKIIGLILPHRCLYCGKIVQTAHSVCEDCLGQIHFISKPYCSKCGFPFEHIVATKQNMTCPNCLKNKRHLFRLVRSAVIYEDFSKKAIIALKFSDKTQNAKTFAKWLKFAGKDIFSAGADVFIPVPMHYKKLIKRRYNQAALLALELSQLTNISTDLTNLVKIKNTKPQVNYSKAEREQNLKHAFSVQNPQMVRGKRVVLIDDVLTTGTTLEECAKVLLKNGALSVDALTVARVL